MYIDSSFNGTQRDADQPVAILLRANIEPLLVKYNVNLALWGHHHSYQVKDNKDNDNNNDNNNNTNLFSFYHSN